MIKFMVAEYIGDYPIDHQPLWNKRFDTIEEAVKAAMDIYFSRLDGYWEPDMEARPDTGPLTPEDHYHITIQASNPDDEGAFDDWPVWGIGCIPELDPNHER